MNNGQNTIYIKDTNRGLYINCNSYEPRHTKTAWIRALYGRAQKICSNNSLIHKQVACIKKVMPWIGFPHYIQNKIIKCLENRKNTKNTDTLEQENIATIVCRIPYAGVQGEKLIKNLVRKLKRHIHEPFKLRNIDHTKKLSYYCNTTDQNLEHLKSQIRYEFCCPACCTKYSAKTNQNFYTCVEEHSGSDKKSPVYNHLLECEHFDYVVNLLSLPPSNKLVEYLEHVKIAVYDNTKIIDNSQNRTELCFLEKLHIKWKKPKTELWH